MIRAFKRFIRRLVARYIFLRDIEEKHREVLQTLAEGKESDREAFTDIANVTGNEEMRVRAERARREAARLERQLAGMVDMYARGRHGGEE